MLGVTGEGSAQCVSQSMRSQVNSAAFTKAQREALGSYTYSGPILSPCMRMGY